MVLRLPLSTLFPYTTLFRSELGLTQAVLRAAPPWARSNALPANWLVTDEGAKFLDWNLDRKSTRLNSSHSSISYAVFCLKKKTRLINRIEIPSTTKHLVLIA